MGTQMPTARPDTRGLPSCFLIGHNAFLGQPCTEEEEEQRGMKGGRKGGVRGGTVKKEKERSRETGKEALRSQ